jgi:hypothetical protein
MPNCKNFGAEEQGILRAVCAMKKRQVTIPDRGKKIQVG